MAIKTLLIIFVAVASVSAQTFQYSRGWTNGKRSSIHHDWSENRKSGDATEDIRIVKAKDMSWDKDNAKYMKDPVDLPVRHMSPNEVAKGISASLSRISPCQMNKLKYILQGWSLDDESLYLICPDSNEEDEDPPAPTPKPKKWRRHHSEQPTEVFPLESFSG